MRLFLHRFPAVGGLLLFAFLCTALIGAQYFRPHGTTIIVTTTADSGPGSLRSAIAAANDGDTIQFDPFLEGHTIFLTTGELVLDKNLTITGLGFALLAVSRDQQASNFRIFHLMPNHSVEISGLTISNGNLTTGNGAGILNDHATLTISNCTITGNATTGDSYTAGGGGIYNSGTLGLVNSSVNNNSSGTFAYGGGGIWNTGNLTITQSSINSNSGNIKGGGILSDGGGTLTIVDSMISNNHSTSFGHFGGDGGGVWNNGSMTIQNTIISSNVTNGGDITPGNGGGIYGSGTITNCTIKNNSSGRGGGIYANGTITNCTISGNIAVNRDGGGLWGGGTVSNSTISGNTAGQNGGGIFGGGTISNSTVSGNMAGQGGGIYATAAINLTNTILKAGTSGANIVNSGGSVTSHGYNLSSDNGGGFLSGPGDLVNVDPLLGPLQDNGGPTFTHELLPGSPAINTGDPNFTPPPLYDQRGFGYLRVYDNRLDIGSFEVQPPPTVSPTPTSTATATATASPTATATATATPTVPPSPSPVPTPFYCFPISQSTSFEITSGNSVSCNNGTGHTDNSYWRAFDLPKSPHCGPSYIVQSVSFGVESVNQTQPVTVRLYINNGDPFPGGTRTLIGSTTINVNTAQSGTVVTTPLNTGFGRGNEQLIMELFTPDGQTAGNLFFVGSNIAPQTGPSYLSAAACGAATPTDLATLGFPDMHIVFLVDGFCEGTPCPPATPTATATATSTATASPTSTPTATAKTSVTPTPTPTVPPTPTPTPSPSPANIVVTTTNDFGAGSLRQALADAHDGDIVGFDPALNGQTITLTTAELLVDKNISISAGSVRVARDQQAPNFRIFYIMPNHTAVISGLTISNGNLHDASGAGILNDHATLTIIHCTISGNTVTNDGSPQAGGAGICNKGTLTLASSTVTGNSAIYTWSYGGGGILNAIDSILTITQSTISNNSGDQSGGGIQNNGMLTINDSTVSGNQCTGFGHGSGAGGGIHNGGTLTIQNTIISGNAVAGEGGFGGGVSGNLTAINSTITNNLGRIGGGISGGGTITNCTISGNGAALGGGIYGSGNIANSTISGNGAKGDGGGIYGSGTVSNSTISGNTANGDGGGIYGAPTITNSTISGNTANSKGGSIYATFGNVQLRNTILKGGNSAATIVSHNGSVASLGYNLCSDDCGGFLTGPGDQINTDPMLSPLQDNGGPTFTHDLLNGSPAIDTGDPNFTPPPSSDQRGYLRVFNNRIDIGSLEAQPIPTPTPSPSASPAQLLNISTRLRVETGANELIAGFIISGSQPATVIIRGIGPTLANFGVPDVLLDPTLELRGSSAQLLAANDNWQDDPVEPPFAAYGLAPGDPLESAILATLNPGQYTALVAGKDGGTGVGLVEVYDVTNSMAGATFNSRLGNISTRGLVQTGADIMIGGFILGGTAGNSAIIIRGIGPTLGQFGIPNPLADPTLELHDSNGAILVANDNWQDDPASAAQLIAHGLPLQDPLESGIYISLPPSLYTAIVAGKDGGTGVGLVEIYNVN